MLMACAWEIALACLNVALLLSAISSQPATAACLPSYDVSFFLYVKIFLIQKRGKVIFSFFIFLSQFNAFLCCSSPLGFLFTSHRALGWAFCFSHTHKHSHTHTHRQEEKV